MRIDKIDATVIKLNRETKQGNIKWEILDITPSSLSGTEVLTGFVYRTKIQDKWLRLYKYQYRHYIDQDDWDYISSHKLELVDDKGKTFWEFPKDLTIRDLYETVTLKTSKAEDFFESYLND